MWYINVVAKRILVIILIVVGLGLLGFGGYRYWLSKQPNAGLKVETTPVSMVFVDNLQIGQSPIEKIFKPGEVNLKIIPNSTDSALSTYQTKVRLNPKTYTVVRRDFGPTDADTAGEIVTLEPQSGKPASLVVVTSNPDSASVSIDGDPQGFSPILVPSVAAGDHVIVVSAPGFATRTISAKAVAGFKLTLNVKLAGQPSPLPTIAVQATSSATLKVSGTPSPSPNLLQSPARPYVEIKDTPVGFLRVRSGPSTSSKEVGQVKPGDKLSLLDSQTGWYLVEADLPSTSSGWISAQYAEKYE
jgi:hypothetical protein